MENAFIIFKQTGIMFFYMAIGFTLYKMRLITKEGSASMANLLLYAVLPAVVINSFCAENARGKYYELLVSILVGAVLLVLAMVVSHLLFRKNPINDFGAAFSNAGFMGFPLITALLGQEALFCAAGFVAMLNALQWTYGQYLLSGNKKDLSPGKVLKNPLVLSLVAGLLIFFSGVQVPPVVGSALAAVSSMNAPLAMVILGVYLAQMDVRKTVGNIQLYAVSAVRLILIPLISLTLLYILPGLSLTMKSSLFIVAMAPVGSNVAVYAQKQGKDYPSAVGLVCLSTLFSIATMPVMIILNEFLLG